MQKVFIDQIKNLVPDLKLITHDANYGCLGDQITYSNFGDDIVLDEEDYSGFIHDAIQYASHLGVERIVVIGIFTQDIHQQLEKVRDRFNVVKVDISSCKIDYTDRDNIKFSRSRLSYFPECELLYELVESEVSTLFVVFESIENFYYPGPFVKLLRKLVSQNSANRILLSTNLRGQDYKDKYKFDYRVREWRELEIAHYMISMGFTIEDLFIAQKNNQRSIVCLILHALDYQGFLEKYFLVSDTDSVLVTSFFDGIDDVNKQDIYFRHISVSLRNIYSLFDKKPIVVYFPRLIEISEQKKDLENNFITPWKFYDDKHIENFLNYDQRSGRFLIYHLFYQIYLFFDIKFIHTHDYDGMIYRIQDAINSHIFPKDIKTVIYTFAIRIRKSHYNETILSYEEIFDLDYEKEVLERSDLIVVENKRIIDLYNEILGIKFSDQKIVIRQFPIRCLENSSCKLENVVYHTTHKCDLLFIGQPDLYHGFDRFINILEYIASSDDDKNLDRLSHRIKIYLIKPCTDMPQYYRSKLDDLSNKLDIRIFEIFPEEIEKIISENSFQNIAVLPYLDNFYISGLISDMVKHGLAFVTHKDFLPHDLYERLKNYLFLSKDNDLSEYIESLKELLDGYDKIYAYFDQLNQTIPDYSKEIDDLFLNSVFSALSNEFEDKQIVLDEVFHQKVSVVISVYKIEFKYIEELCQSINYQSVRPFEVIFVDDGSGEDYHEELIQIVSKSLKLPYKIVYQENKGQAAAVNHGIRLSNGDFVLCVDADDVLIYNILERYLTFLLSNSEYQIVLGYPRHFDESEKSYIYASYAYPHYSFSHRVRPLLFMSNSLGGFYFMFDKRALRDYCFLDETDNYKWADYAFLIKLTLLGFRRGLLNEPVLGYRQRKSSRSRTVSSYTGQLRIIRNYFIFSRFESYALMSMLLYSQKELDLLNQIQLFRDRSELLERDLECKKKENLGLLNQVDKLNEQIESLQDELSVFSQKLEIEKSIVSSLQVQLSEIRNRYETTIGLLSVRIALKLSNFVSNNIILKNLYKILKNISSRNN